MIKCCSPVTAFVCPINNPITFGEPGLTSQIEILPSAEQQLNRKGLLLANFTMETDSLC